MITKFKSFEKVIINNPDYQEVFDEFERNKGKYIVYSHTYHSNKICVGKVGRINPDDYYVDIYSKEVGYTAYHMMNIEVYGFCDDLDCIEQLKKDVELQKDTEKYNL